MGEEEPNDSGRNNLPREISAIIGNKETLNEKKSKSGKEKKTSSKTLLFGNHSKNVVIMSSLPWNILPVVKRVL
tara:strand:+ start:1309 stop:1530 length:222 start_codon:yes stop_codon:yes gene_type:complete